MDKTRLEAFSDGVIAIIITIMVLEMKVPHARYRHRRVETFVAGVSELRAELSLRRHLLEQSSLYAACHSKDQRYHVMGQPALVVLAVPISRS